MAFIEEPVDSVIILQDQDELVEESGRLVQRVMNHRYTQFLISPTLLTITSALLLFVYYQGSLYNDISNVTSDVIRGAIIFTILALGSGLVLSTSYIDISSVGVATLSGVIFAVVLSYEPGFQIYAAILIAMIPAILFSISSGLLIALFIVYWRAPPLILTWAIGAIYVIVAILLTKLSSSGVSSTVSGISLPFRLSDDAWTFGGVGTDSAIIVVLLAVLLASFIGLPARATAIGSSETSAEYAGISKTATLLQCLVFNSIMASLAGIFEALYLSRATTRDLVGNELVPIAIAVLGGTSLSGGYLFMPSIILAALFWSGIRLLGPQLQEVLPVVDGYQAEFGQLLFYLVFVIVALVFGRLLAPTLAKIYARRE